LRILARIIDLGVSMAEPKISVVIPFYNGERFLDEALQSVMTQILRPCEVIIIDDGSAESASEYLKQIQMDIPTHIVKQQNAGQSAARNHGVRLSIGDYIAFLDQDDVWYPLHLKKLFEPFRSKHAYRLGWVYSNFDEIDENSHLVHLNFLDGAKKQHPKCCIRDIISRDCFVLPSASLLLKEAFQELGGFDERLCGYEDDDLFRRFFSAKWRHHYVSKASCAWRIHTDSTTQSPRMDKSRKIYVSILLEAFPDSPRLNRFWRSQVIVQRFLASQLRSFFFFSIKLKDFELSKNAKQQFLEYMHMLPKEYQWRWKLCFRLVMRPRLLSFFYHRFGKYLPRSWTQRLAKAIVPK
jgi:glycosyltransferase involved in cell wall biosynthesis